MCSCRKMQKKNPYWRSSIYIDLSGNGLQLAKEKRKWSANCGAHERKYIYVLSFKQCWFTLQTDLSYLQSSRVHKFVWERERDRVYFQRRHHLYKKSKDAFTPTNKLTIRAIHIFVLASRIIFWHNLYRITFSNVITNNNFSLI